jgi:ABC-type cobalamin/Fe3+-siderophores transport systems, ATPase components
MTAMIQASHVTVQAGPVRLLSDTSLTIGPGEFVAIIGPNGAGKSTLLSLLSGERRADSGELRLDGRPIERWRVKDLARRRAVMQQHSSLAFPFTVAEVVSLGLGRSAHVPAGDLHRFMAATHIAHLARRLYTTLSGGERQRVHFARALAQLSAVPPGQTPFLLLDEPTSSLDPGHQHLVLAAARSWMEQTNGTVIAVLHDLTLAAQYGDRVMLLSDGEMRWQGPATDIPAAMLEAAYGLSFCCVEMPGRGSPCYVPVPPGKGLPH